jgi:hypothetical protein
LTRSGKRLFQASTANQDQGEDVHTNRDTNSHKIRGKRFGRLVARYPTEKRSKENCIMWWCDCDCGNSALVKSVHLTRSANVIRSCGCLLTEMNQRRGVPLGLEPKPEWSASDWARHQGINPKTIRGRLKKGWEPLRAVTAPV